MSLELHLKSNPAQISMVRGTTRISGEHGQVLITHAISGTLAASTKSSSEHVFDFSMTTCVLRKLLKNGGANMKT